MCGRSWDLGPLSAALGVLTVATTLTRCRRRERRQWLKAHSSRAATPSTHYFMPFVTTGAPLVAHTPPAPCTLHYIGPQRSGGCAAPCPSTVSILIPGLHLSTHVRPARPSRAPSNAGVICRCRFHHVTAQCAPHCLSAMHAHCMTQQCKSTHNWRCGMCTVASAVPTASGAERPAALLRDVASCSSLAGGGASMPTCDFAALVCVPIYCRQARHRGPQRGLLRNLDEHASPACRRHICPSTWPSPRPTIPPVHRNPAHGLDASPPWTRAGLK